MTTKKTNSASVNGQPFSMLVAGRKHYVFTDLSDIVAIHKTKTLDIKNFVRMLLRNLFGMSDKQAIKLGTMKQAFHEINTTYLLTSANNVVETSKYFTFLDEIFNAMDKQIKDNTAGSVTKDGFVLVTETQGNATVQAYFGKALLDLNPKILVDLTVFTGEGFYSLLSGAPNIFFPKPVRAREQVARNLEDYIKIVNKDESSSAPFIAARIRLMKEQGIEGDAAARELLSVMFG